MPKKSRAGGGTPAGKRESRSGRSSPNSAHPAVQEDYEILPKLNTKFFRTKFSTYDSRLHFINLPMDSRIISMHCYGMA
eukprot:SAG31_NODE_1118_length_9816_cov_41.561593_4_plen_79_part_00